MKKTPEEIQKLFVAIVWSEEDNCFLAAVPEIDGLICHGDSKEEALDNLVELTREYCLDIIFEKDKLKTPDEWCKFHDLRIMDPDGWREDNKSWSDLITDKEFQKRAMASTVSLSDWMKSITLNDKQ